MDEYTNRYIFDKTLGMSKAERTKEYIVEKTAPIFNKKGFAGTSLTDLTEATGLTKGALYGNFANKDEIALAVFDYNLSLVNGPFLGVRDWNISAVDQLLSIPELVKANFPLLAVHGGCPILNTSVEADDNHPLLKKRVNTAIALWRKNIEAVIEKGIEEKTIKEEVDPRKYSAIILTLVEGSLMLAKIMGDLPILHEAMDKLRDIILIEIKK